MSYIKSIHLQFHQPRSFIELIHTAIQRGFRVHDPDMHYILDGENSNWQWQWIGVEQFDWLMQQLEIHIAARHSVGIGFFIEDVEFVCSSYPPYDHLNVTFDFDQYRYLDDQLPFIDFSVYLKLLIAGIDPSETSIKSVACGWW